MADTLASRRIVAIDDGVGAQVHIQSYRRAPRTSDVGSLSRSRVWEEAIRNFYTELLTVTSERVSFFSYAWLIASLLMIVGITRGLDQMQEVSELGVLAMVLAFMSIDGILLLLLASLVVIEVARTIDTYLRDSVFNINIIRFIFTVASMGLIVAGIIEIVNDLLVENNFESDNVQYVLGGIILAFLGLLVHDSIRERVDEKLLPVEE